MKHISKIQYVRGLAVSLHIFPFSAMCIARPHRAFEKAHIDYFRVERGTYRIFRTLNLVVCDEIAVTSGWDIEDEAVPLVAALHMDQANDPSDASKEEGNENAVVVETVEVTIPNGLW